MTPPEVRDLRVAAGASVFPYKERNEPLASIGETLSVVSVTPDVQLRLFSRADTLGRA